MLPNQLDVSFDPEHQKFDAVHTVVHVDTHAYIDTFTDLEEAEDYIFNNEPERGMWKIITKVFR